MTPSRDAPGIRILPPVLYLVAFLAGYGLERAWPLVHTTWGRWSTVTGIALVIASLLIAASVIIRFRRASTPFDVRKAATTLVTEGANRYSRNPGYLALTMLYVGLALLAESLWALLLLAPTLVVLTYAVVKKEEAHLERRFGDAYRRYRSRVRRWL